MPPLGKTTVDLLGGERVGDERDGPPVGFLAGGALAFAAALIAALVFLPRGPALSPVATVSGQAAVGSRAPEFTSRDLDGRSVTLSSYRGRPVLVNFWATWCTACESEMPAIQQASQRYRNAGLAVLAVDYRETNVRAMRNFFDRMGVRFDTALDPDGAIAQAYGVNVGLPVSVFIDRAGRITAIQVGEMSAPVLEQRLTTVL